MFFLGWLLMYDGITLLRLVLAMNQDGITLLHFGVVEHSLCGVDWVTASIVAKLTSLMVV